MEPQQASAAPAASDSPGEVGVQDPAASAGRLLPAWRLPEPMAVRRADGGTNNIVLIVDTGGASYVLRVYQNLAPGRVAAEHRLLDALAGAGLPFAVPKPVPTPDGETYVSAPEGIVALFPYLPGHTPDPDRLEEIERAGEALALLGLALADLPADLAPIDWRDYPLDRIHPAVTDLDELADELATALPGHPGVEWLATHAVPSDQRYAQLCRTLPVRIVHGDFAVSNVLVDSTGKPTAVLDFEVAGLDLAVTDVVAGIAQVGGGWWTPDAAIRTNAFYRGYTRHVTITPAERAAVADLLRLRVLASIVWRAGRWRRGQAHFGEVQLRLDTGLHIGRWLEAHQATLPDVLAAL